jgi:hypothetical protein
MELIDILIYLLVITLGLLGTSFYLHYNLASLTKTYNKLVAKYNTKLDNYDDLVTKYNEQLDLNDLQVDEYNLLVRKYNSLLIKHNLIDTPSEEKINIILEKISLSGKESLNEEDKVLLELYSNKK